MSKTKSKYGYRGVSKFGDEYVACGKIDGLKWMSLQRYPTARLAAIAYDTKRLEVGKKPVNNILKQIKVKDD